MDRQFSRAADRRQRLSQSRAQIGHGASGQSHPATEQDLPADPHRQGSHQGKSSRDTTRATPKSTHPEKGKIEQHEQKLVRKVQIPESYTS